VPSFSQEAPLNFDHRTRTGRSHSHKYNATLQAAQAGPAPVLTRIETRAGHGANRSTQQVIDERAHAWALLVHVLEMKVRGSSLPGSVGGASALPQSVRSWGPPAGGPRAGFSPASKRRP
jgi:hypothetical protein